MEDINGFQNQDNVLQDNNIKGIRNLALEDQNNAANNAGGNGDLQEVVVHQDIGNQQAVENDNNGGQVNGQQQNARANANNLQNHVQQNAVDQHQVNLLGRQQVHFAMQNVPNGHNGHMLNVQQLFHGVNQAAMQQGGVNQQQALIDRQQNLVAAQDAPVNLQIGAGQGHQQGLHNFERDGNNRQVANVFDRQRIPLGVNNNDVIVNPQGGQGNNLFNINRFNINNHEVMQNVGNIPRNVNHLDALGPQQQQQNLALQNANMQLNIDNQNNNARNQNQQPIRRQNAINNRNAPYTRPNRNVQMRQNCEKMASFLWSMAKQTTYVSHRRDNEDTENDPNP